MHDPLFAAAYPKIAARLAQAVSQSSPAVLAEGTSSGMAAPARRMPRSPQPESVLMCTYCHQRWDIHMAVAGEDPVSFAHCVQVLQNVKDRVQAPSSSFGPLVHQQATTGPKGDTGPPGMDGKPGSSIDQVQVIVADDGSRRLQLHMSDGQWKFSNPW